MSDFLNQTPLKQDLLKQDPFKQAPHKQVSLLNIKAQYDLSTLNTLSLAGVADYFARFNSVSELLALLEYAKTRQLKVKVLGGGSNMIVQPQVTGLVVQSAMQGVERLSEDDTTITYAVDAGLNWHQWVLKSIELGAFGLENLALIPGTVGASPIQNIGAYGVEVGQCIEEVRGMQLSTGQWMSFSAAQCNFSYRDSIFKRQFKNDFIITQVVFKLSKAFKPQTSYAPLKQMAEQFYERLNVDVSVDVSVDTPSLTAQKVAGWVIEVRNSKLPDPKIIPNAGSFFTNPIIPKSQADELSTQFPNMPVYPVQCEIEGAEKQVKVAAGWLIDQCDWKAHREGDAGVYEKHALVLVNHGNASGFELWTLAEQIQGSIQQKFGISLEPEPRLIS